MDKDLYEIINAEERKKKTEVENWSNTFSLSHLHTAAYIFAVERERGQKQAVGKIRLFRSVAELLGKFSIRDKRNGSLCATAEYVVHRIITIKR